VWLPFVFAAALLLALFVAARRATTILALRVEDGRVVERRGRAPGELLRDLDDIFARAGATGHLALRMEDRGVVVCSDDLDATVQQQIRNVVGRFPPARLKTAPAVRRR